MERVLVLKQPFPPQIRKAWWMGRAAMRERKLGQGTMPVVTQRRWVPQAPLEWQGQPPERKPVVSNLVPGHMVEQGRLTEE